MNRPQFTRSLAFKYVLIVILPLSAMFYSQITNTLTLLMGEQVMLETRPVDPRDILRGDYVILDYLISDIDDSLADDGKTDIYDLAGREVFVTLERDESGIGSVKSASLARPSERLYIKGTFGSSWDRSVRYGIEAYFVPEGTGGEIEDMINDAEVKVLADVRVLRGHPVIKALKFVKVTDK
ncbi:MAG: GDYXXLXY domain-containing protein [Synergistaceae bacterium]|jgi:uncharacterized membrane-anchored protein|nr:GDYXXLXY domain-containing protein [Synergistaceae bacterium]